MIPLASRTNEFAPSAPIDPARANGARLGLLIGRTSEGELCAGLGVDEPFGHPSTLDRDTGRPAPNAIERGLELRLEEHVVRLPAGARRGGHVEAQQRGAVGAEPVVLVDRDQLVSERLGKPERLKQAHDLVVQMDRARQPVDLLVALEHDDAMPGSAEQRRDRLAHRAVSDDRDIRIEGAHDITDGTGAGDSTGRVRI